MKKKICILIASAVIISLSSCTAMNNVSESVKDKNIAAGSDTWGGYGDVGFTMENGWIPNISFWFGRRKVWYVSLKKDESTKDIANIVNASNTPLGLSAGTNGIGATNGQSSLNDSVQTDSGVGAQK